MLPPDALATTPVLTSERLQLRALGPEHLEPLWASVNDPELRRLTGTTATFTREGLAAWLAARAAAVLDHAFETVGLHRVGLDVFAFNTGAILAYERLGFRHEGRLREVLHQQGEWHDSLLMGLLRREWRA